MAVERLEYPIEDSTDYGGRVVFKVIQEDEADLGELAKSSKSKTGDIAEKAKEIVGGDTEAARNAYNSHRGLINQTLKSKIPNRYLREVSLYLPIGLAFRDNVGYENTELLSAGTGAKAATGAAGLSYADAGNSAAAREVGSLALVAAAQKNAGLGSFARAGAGITVNPNQRSLFKSVNLREFAFTFKFLPCSARESEEVKKIIQLFREELYPEDIPAGGISLGYRFPNRFQIDIEYNKERVTSKILPCFLRDVSVTYNPSTMAMHDDGNFSEIDMNLSFVESRTLDKNQIKAGF